MFIKDGKTLNETNCTQEFAGTKDKCTDSHSIEDFININCGESE